MSFESISPNMSLILPGVGQTIGPTWATDLNNSLTIIDQHNHTAGYGVPVPSSGLNINADLTMANNNLIGIKSLRMTPQSILAGGSDLDCLFVNGVDLYYNDGVGNHVRITQSGGVAGSPGSIANLTSPASATYVAGTQTFVWQSDANTPANMDNASVILRNLSANSFGLTLSPPAAMGANYSLTLPTLPSSQKIMTLDNSGNISAPYTVDNVTINIVGNVIQVKNTNVVSVSTNTTISSANSDYLVDTTSGDITMTLPTAVGGSRPIVIKKVSTDGNHVILATTGGQTIDGVASGSPKLSAVNDSLTLQSNGANYIVCARYVSQCRGRRSTTINQTITNDSITTLALATVSTNNMSSSGVGQLDILYDGYYSISVNSAWQNNNAGSRSVWITLNSVDISGMSTPGNAGAPEPRLSASISNILLLAGDAIKLHVYQNSSGSLDTDASDTNYNSLDVVRVGVLGDV